MGASAHPLGGGREGGGRCAWEEGGAHGRRVARMGGGWRAWEEDSVHGRAAHMGEGWGVSGRVGARRVGWGRMGWGRDACEGVGTWADG